MYPVSLTVPDIHKNMLNILDISDNSMLKLSIGSLNLQ